MERLNVFVSSTIHDLVAERNAVKKVFEEMRFNAFLSEYQSSSISSPWDVCLKNITQCDMFILIIGEKYGYTPCNDPLKISPFNGQISVTEGEFLKAQELRKPILVFVKNIKKREKEEQIFLDSLAGFLDGHFYSYFNDENELSNKLYESIPDLLVNLVRYNYISPWRRKPSLIITPSSDEASNIGADIIGYFIMQRPKANIGLFAGRTASDIFYKFFKQFSANEMKNIVNTKFYSVTEHFGISGNNKNSYCHWFNQAFFKRVFEEWNITIPENNKRLVPSFIESDTLEGFKISYDQDLQINKVDVQLISPAPNGQIICIDPLAYSVDDMLKMGTELVRYSDNTSKYLVPVSPHNLDIIIGFKNLFSRSEYLVVMATGSEKKEVVRRMIIGPIGNDCPASLLSYYPRENKIIYVIDKKASENLPKNIENHVNLIQYQDWKHYKDHILGD